MSWVRGLFEIENRDRLLPMEGLRGVAVGLVFLQHYCEQFLSIGGLNGATKAFASAFRLFGNYGVELFFVLSGFLIYGILIRKRPGFMPFMLRRAQRLYPAFVVALIIGIGIDWIRPVPKIPHGLSSAVAYIAANLAFLPGLFPIEPLFAVNWSLSYEWWFYACCVTVVSVVDLRRVNPRNRCLGIAAVGLCLVLLSAAGVPGVPIRGLSFLSGLFLVEVNALRLGHAPPTLGVLAALLTFILCVGFVLPGWFDAVILACGFFTVCSAAFQGQHFLARVLSSPGLRALGNASYSFYLVHGFAVVATIQLLLRLFPSLNRDIVFWVLLAPVFAVAFFVSAVLFLAIEKPFSLETNVSKRVAASAATYT